MADPGPPSDAAAIMESVNDALQGLELEPNETADILGFANRELPHLHTPEDSYFILGSYRDRYLRRLRIVQNKLDKRLGTYPFLMADLPELISNDSQSSGFDLRFSPRMPTPSSLCMNRMLAVKSPNSGKSAPHRISINRMCCRVITRG